MIKAYIWTSAPHETDGIYVEVLEQLSRRSTKFFQVQSEWFPTVQACREYAIAAGAELIEEK